jgi:hypothetical protein
MLDKVVMIKYSGEECYGVVDDIDFDMGTYNVYVLGIGNVYAEKGELKVVDESDPEYYYTKAMYLLHLILAEQAKVQDNVMSFMQLITELLSSKEERIRRESNERKQV